MKVFHLMGKWKNGINKICVHSNRGCPIRSLYPNGEELLIFYNRFEVAVMPLRTLLQFVIHITGHFNGQRTRSPANAIRAHTVERIVCSIERTANPKPEYTYNFIVNGH